MISDEWRRRAYKMLDDFVMADNRSEHLLLCPLRAYCRKSRRLIGPMLDIASVDVSDQGKGYFRIFLGQAELVAAQRKLGVYVENALNPILHEMLERRGYRETKHAPLCFYKTWVDLL